MELLESKYFQIWVGIGVAYAIGTAILQGSDNFDIKSACRFRFSK